MPAKPKSFNDDTFTDVASIVLIAKDASDQEWHQIRIENCANEDLLIAFSAANITEMRVPANSSERMEIKRGFIEVFGKLENAGTGQVTINVA